MYTYRYCYVCVCPLVCDVEFLASPNFSDLNRLDSHSQLLLCSLLFFSSSSLPPSLHPLCFISSSILLYCVTPFIHSFLHLFICTFIHSFIHLFLHSFIHSFIPPFILFFLHSFIPPFLYSFISASDPHITRWGQLLTASL